MMIVLQRKKETVEVTLPSFEGSKVLCNKGSMSLNEMNMLRKKWKLKTGKADVSDDMGFLADIAISSIVSWNFTDTEGNDVDPKKSFDLIMDNFGIDDITAITDVTQIAGGNKEETAKKA